MRASRRQAGPDRGALHQGEGSTAPARLATSGALYSSGDSVATATAHAKVPVVVAAAMTGHSPAVYSEHYARPFRDAEERQKVRNSLASIGFGNPPLTNALT
jgi:hypothetical protein